MSNGTTVRRSQSSSKAPGSKQPSPAASAARRSGSARPHAQAASGRWPMPRAQEPPWITWNRPGSLFPAISFLVLFTLLIWPGASR